MSAISVILLLTAGLALAACLAALRAARGLRGEVAALRADLSLTALPRTRTVPDEELIRAAVADALADERDRELAEARAFWAEQESRDAVGSAGRAGGGLAGVAPSADELLLDALLERYLSDGDVEYAEYPEATGTEHAEHAEHADRPGRAVAPGGDGEETDAEAEALDSLSLLGEAGHLGSGYLDDAHDGDYRGPGLLPRQSGTEGAAPVADQAGEEGQWAAELAAARRRHPSHPGYTLSGEPVTRPATGTETAAEEYERTTERLTRLAKSGTPLADVRPGPLGTLDVYLFEDGTTLCLSPGHRETSQRLASAVRSGRPPVLLGGSGVSGAYALTFGCGEESIYLLADRIVTA